MKFVVISAIVLNAAILAAAQGCPEACCDDQSLMCHHGDFGFESMCIDCDLAIRHLLAHSEDQLAGTSGFDCDCDPGDHDGCDTFDDVGHQTGPGGFHDITGLATAFQCCAECRAEPECLGFTWTSPEWSHPRYDEDVTHCFLYDTPSDGVTPHEHCTSGNPKNRDCPETCEGPDFYTCGGPVPWCDEEEQCYCGLHARDDGTLAPGCFKNGRCDSPCQTDSQCSGSQSCVASDCCNGDCADPCLEDECDCSNMVITPRMLLEAGEVKTLLDGHDCNLDATRC